LNNSSQQRVGLYGGAFDPPHTGHHALAACAIRQLQLDVLHVLPTGDAWHKTRALSDATHRMAMAALNFADLPQVLIDERELRRNGPSYTVDSLRELADQYPGAGFFLLMGEDQAARFDTWKDWQQIAQLAQLAVAPRQMQAQSSGLLHEWHNHPLVKATLLNMPLEIVSATDIRCGLQQGLLPGQSLKPSVFQYIQHHHLYMDRHDRSL